MHTRNIGGIEVSAIGLGGMPLSVGGRPDRERGLATVRAALDAGITFIDTADAYSQGAEDFGHNEELIAEAVRGHDVLISTKGGHTRTADGGWALDGRPEYLKAACEASLRRLGVEAIGLYHFHRPDPAVPTAESVGALRELLDEGKIRLAAVSNFDPGQIREANEVLGGRLAAVQNQFSPVFRSSEPELELCAAEGIAFLPWSPLGGIGKAGDLGGGLAPFKAVADDRGVSPQQVALAWMLAKSDRVVPIPGSSRPESIQDSARAADLVLTADELDALG
ncbi:aldo/keto reductase [Actinokineospora bangkokensis]|uniref:Aldo/keto reductase n=1 Tax=Actinokineospora bangkokensis TaxID=1193682 RepID=A0A1Q9LJF0_9PSEU|nr:aldo/keto reductase [Actinokineospora bangkokensis]OLR92133.1 aldo/keto reductase [Actinokineospora bangkokensis]